MHFPGRETGPVPGCSCPKYSTYLLWEYRQRLQGQGAGRYGEFIALCVLGTLSGKAEQGGMAAAQLSLFPSTAPGRQSLLPRDLPDPWDPSHRTVVNPCGNRRTAGVEQLECAETNCPQAAPVPHSPVTTYTSHVHPPGKKLPLHPPSIPTPSCDTAQGSSPEPNHLLCCSPAAHHCRVCWCDHAHP